MKALVVSIFLVVLPALAGAGSNSWSSLNGKDLEIKGKKTDEGCPDGTVEYRAGKDHFLLTIGARHSFDWHAKKSSETEKIPNDCEITTVREGNETAVVSTETAVHCIDKDSDGVVETKLQLTGADSAKYSRTIKNAKGKSIKTIQCELVVSKAPPPAPADAR